MMSRPPAFARINDYVSWHAQAHPDTIALVSGATRVTYRELAGTIERLAAALLAAGVGKGDRVAALAPPHPDFVVAFLATASIGAIWVGLNPRYRFDELKYVLDDSTPTVLLARSELHGRHYASELQQLRADCPGIGHLVIFEGDPPVPRGESMREFLQRGGTVEAAELADARANCGGRDPCLIVYTSGSTGAPKGALLHHEGITTFSRTQNELWPVGPLRVLNYFPINHLGCVVDCTTPCLVAGGTVIFMEQFDAAASLELMAREQVTMWASVPSVFQMQLGLPDFASYDLSAVRLIVWEGAAMPVDSIERLRRICPRLATNYGMTETASAITVTPPTDDLEVLGNSVGHPFPGVEVRLVDASGEESAAGEIHTRSRSNFLGYWRRPDATAEAFTPDGYFKTGDLGEWRSDGRLHLVGRIKEMFKSGGYNIYPREVEIVLEAHPAVALAAVVAVPDPLWQEVGVAFVALRTPATCEELEAHCRARLANYKVPKRFVIEADLPLLPIGKVDKRALKARATSDGEARATVVGG